MTHVISHGRDILPDNKRVLEQTLSGNTTAYSQARQRLPLEFVQDFRAASEITWESKARRNATPK